MLAATIARCRHRGRQRDHLGDECDGCANLDTWQVVPGPRDVSPRPLRESSLNLVRSASSLALNPFASRVDFEPASTEER